MEVLTSLVRWPIKLEVFDFEYISWPFNPYNPGVDPPLDWSLNILQPVLNIHLATLRVIRICNINYCDQSNFDPFSLITFDLHEFTALTHLTLSRLVTGTDPRLIKHLIAPQLREFCWDFMGDQNKSSHAKNGFTQVEESWLRALVRESRAGWGIPTLQKIEIRYTPSTDLPREDRADQWNRLKALARELRRIGITLWWNGRLVLR